MNLLNVINQLPNRNLETLKNTLDDYNLSIKEKDGLILIYCDNKGVEGNVELENNCRSIILDSKTLEPIGSQYSRIIYNEEAEEYLQECDWDKVSVQKCFEGTYLLVYNHNNKWYISTRRCIDASESVWIKGMSYLDMFNDARQDKFEMSELNPDYCYHFVLVHYKNRNIVNYSHFERHFKEVYHVMTSRTGSLAPVDTIINDNVALVVNEKFPSFDNLKNALLTLSSSNEASSRITSEGYILKVYNSDGTFKILKIQTPIYRRLSELKPNNSNFHQIYLELYQKDNLKAFLPFFERFNSDTIKRIDIAMKNVSKEILDVYHMTRQKKNPDVYIALTEQYRKVLYGLHGLYIENRRIDFPDSKTGLFDKKMSKSINVHDVYHYLKNIPAHELRRLFSDRLELLKVPKMTFMNDCINTIAHTKLMFPN